MTQDEVDRDFETLTKALSNLSRSELIMYGAINAISIRQALEAEFIVQKDDGAILFVTPTGLGASLEELSYRVNQLVKLQRSEDAADSHK